MRDPVLHDKRRRHGWDRAFTAASLRSYDSRVIKYADILVRQIHATAGQPVDATKWMNYYSFDVMGEITSSQNLPNLFPDPKCYGADKGQTGDLAFGRAFNALEAGESHFYIDMLHNTGIKGSGLGVLPWLSKIPSLLELYNEP